MDYMELIQKRRMSDYLMMAYISANPHTKKPQELFTQLKAQLRKFEKDDIMDMRPEPGAIEKMRKILNKK